MLPKHLKTLIKSYPLVCTLSAFRPYFVLAPSRLRQICHEPFPVSPGVVRKMPGLVDATEVKVAKGKC